MKRSKEALKFIHIYSAAYIRLGWERFVEDGEKERESGWIDRKIKFQSDS